MEMSEEELRLAEVARVEKERHERELLDGLPLDERLRSGDVIPRTTMVLAASVYLATNDLWEVARQVALPRYRVEKWIQEDWWPQAMELARFKQGERLDTGLSRVIDKTLELIEDRLEKGDVRVDQEGNEIRVGPRLKDLKELMQMAIDKRKVVRDSQRSSSLSDDQLLDKLAERLTKMGSVKPSIDGAVRRVNADHDIREAGEGLLVPDLHEGAGVG